MPSPLPWVVVLAGGKGTRVAQFTVDAEGHPAPKQFCRFRGGRTLLSATLDRALALTESRRVIAVVVERQRRWWTRELERYPGVRVLSQPDDHGTAVAVLEAVSVVSSHAEDAAVVVTPSDHDVEDEQALLGSMALALEAARDPAGPVVLLGITPADVDEGYGWILPAASDTRTARPVRAFVEKPVPRVAARLRQRGALWNSFIVAASAGSMMALYRERLPDLLSRCLVARRPGGGWAQADPYRALGPFDFCRQVIRWGHERLRVLAVPACGWTDLGTPSRLGAWLDRHPGEGCFLARHSLFEALPEHRDPGKAA